MSVHFTKVGVQVPSNSGKQVIRTEARFFQGIVKQAAVALSSFTLDFANADHHVDHIEISPEVESFAGTGVKIRVTVQYTDKNGDDVYSGHVGLLVMAEVEES